MGLQRHEKNTSPSEAADSPAAATAAKEESQRSYGTILNLEIETGLKELRRPARGLFLSSLSAGLDTGFSLLLMAVVLTIFNDSAGSPWLRLLLANMYSVGFLLVILGRSELFTEHTALAVFPVLAGRESLASLLRLWAIVYAGNLLGAAAFAVLSCWIAPSLDAVDPAAFETIARELIRHDGWVIFASAVLAGWLMGELAWLIGASRDTISQVAFVWLVTSVIGLLGLHHAVVGTVEVVAGVVSSPNITWADFGHFLLWTTLGNAAGGVFFVALIKYGHAVIQSNDTH